MPCHRLDQRRDQRFQPLAADPVSGLPKGDQRGAHLIVIASLRAGLYLGWPQLPAQHTDRVLTMVTRQLDKFVQYLAFLILVRTAIPLADCFSQFLLSC